MVVHDQRPMYVRLEKKTYTIAPQLGERIFVDMTGAFPESPIGKKNGVVEYYSHHSRSLITKTKSQLPHNMEEFFENMT